MAKKEKKVGPTSTRTLQVTVIPSFKMPAGKTDVSELYFKNGEVRARGGCGDHRVAASNRAQCLALADAFAKACGMKVVPDPKGTDLFGVKGIYITEMSDGTKMVSGL